MNTSDLLADAFERVHGIVHRTLDGMTRQGVGFRPDPDANSVAWLIWHLTRVQDGTIAKLTGAEQVWTAQGWDETFALPFASTASGYGQTSQEVGGVQTSADLLIGYFDAVYLVVAGYLRGVSDEDLDAVIDESYTPPVTLGVRLISILSDSLQHAGQAAYVRGMGERVNG